MDDKSIDNRWPLVETSSTHAASLSNSESVTQDSQCLVPPQTELNYSTIEASENGMAFGSLNVTGAAGVTAHVGHINHINHIYYVPSHDHIAPPPLPNMLIPTTPTPGPADLCIDVTLDEINAFPEEQREVIISAMDSYKAGKVVWAIELLSSSKYSQTALAQRILGHCQIARDFKMGAFNCFRMSAEKGDNKAEFYVGWCFEHPYGTNLCKDSAFLWYTKSAQQGNPKALKALRNIEWLEFMYRGIKDSTDIQSAVGWFRKVFQPEESDEFTNTIKKSANNGDTCAQNLLAWINYFGASNRSNEDLDELVLSALSGHKLAQFELQKRVVSSLAIDVICYQQEIYQLWCNILTPVNATSLTSGTPEDNAKIFRLLTSTKTESAFSRRLLGICYTYGIGTEKSNAQALDSFKRAADDGDDLAQQHLEFWDPKKAAETGDADMAYLLYWYYKKGEGVKINLNKAFRWVWLSAEGGNFEAQNALGDCYENGEGTKVDLQLAVDCYRRASLKSSRAMYNLGTAYQNGKGVKKDFDEAVKWYKEAAESGHTGAQFLLGNIYYNGLGVPKNYKLAQEWYEKAAAAQHPKATHCLAMTYLHGNIGYMDLTAAKYWLEKAAELGDQSAANRLKELPIQHLEPLKILAECLLNPSAFEKLNSILSRGKLPPKQ